MRLIDIREDIDEVIDDDNEGTCELCMSASYYELPTYVFQDGSEIIEVDGYYYYDGYETIDIENVIDFAAFIASREFTDEEVTNLREDGFYQLSELVDEYNQTKETSA